MANNTSTPSQPVQYYTRFDKSQRIEHVVFLLSFSLLGLTGLVQKYAQSPISQFMIETMGGIEVTRQIHHISAVVLMVVSIFHIINI